jgi:formylglycine-generating enzyme required for sulfatase activity
VDIEWGKVKLEQVEKGFDAKSFRIAKYPVTQVQFQAFINAMDGYRNDKWWQDIKRSERPAEPSWKGDNFPRENVSWYEALAFCRWLGKRMGSKIRLPTEWEWQQAATGGDPNREYPWPGEWDTSRCNSYESRLNRTSAVGMYPSGATAHGVLDMAGNVWEWCLNVYEKSDMSAGGRRVIRGGCWNDYPVLLRSTVRREYDADYRFNYIGFRLAQDID